MPWMIRRKGHKSSSWASGMPLPVGGVDDNFVAEVVVKCALTWAAVVDFQEFSRPFTFALRLLGSVILSCGKYSANSMQIGSWSKTLHDVQCPGPQHFSSSWNISACYIESIHVAPQ